MLKIVLFFLFEYYSNQLSGMRGLVVVFCLFVGMADAHWLVVSPNGFGCSIHVGASRTAVPMPTSVLCWCISLQTRVEACAGIFDTMTVLLAGLLAAADMGGVAIELHDIFCWLQ
ncbi:hypothetical protein Nepgr_016381 [Nepenthes gracilis]|uniref:Uncharacterized protein n=1 Tax=Nepenthes gracilis TaxID=150966 RepID=A0AAD3SMK6_NEPGR|nr:hypothetical protein Nepgr_016381 [Nepenthes gracilis]